LKFSACAAKSILECIVKIREIASGEIYLTLKPEIQEG